MRDLEGALRIHVAFHHVVERVGFLREVLAGYARYRFQRTDVVVDTNGPEGADVVAKLAKELAWAPRLSIESAVHDGLQHPHLLTWAHREAMPAEVGRYAYFMYSEDDVLVPWEAIVSWQRDTESLEGEGYLRGFLRVERNDRGTLLATDMRCRGRPVFRTVAGRRYFHAYRPYQACWIYSRAQMRRFMSLDAWTDGRDSRLRREAAAGGMNLVADPDAASRRTRYRVLIPVDDRGVPLPESFVYHLPNNRVTCTDATGRRPAARAPVSELNRSRLWHLARGHWRR